MNCELITIGDEILIGQIVDTNSAWLAQQLNDYGIRIHRISSIQDDRDAVWNALELAEKDVDFVFVTGGLGPTKDDLTKKIVCEYFNTTLIEDATIRDHVAKLLGDRGIEFTELNRQQAEVPEICTVIPNRSGTAPCMWLEREGTIFVFMPGVPFEMKTIMSEEVLPRLAERFQLKSNYHVTLQTYGIPESHLAEMLNDWEDNLPSYIALAYLPNPKGIRLRLSVYGDVTEAIQSEIEEYIKKLQEIIPESLFGREQESLASALGKMLVKHDKTVASAESCTGGNIAHYLTLNPGSSAYFKGSIVAYSNEIKQQVLKVSESNLETFGAVSQQVVEEMALGVCRVMGTDYGIATSGVAGPDGGSDEKPVGTIWFAIATPEGVFSYKKQFGDHRERNIIRSTQTALNYLRVHVSKTLGGFEI